MTHLTREDMQDQGRDFLGHREIFTKWANAVTDVKLPSISVEAPTDSEVRLRFAGQLYAIRHIYVLDMRGRGMSHLICYLLNETTPAGPSYTARLTLFMDRFGNVGFSPNALDANMSKDGEAVLYTLLAGTAAPVG